MLNIQLVVDAVVLLVANQVHHRAGGSTIITLFLKQIEANCDWLSSQKFTEKDQVSPIHSILTILRVEEMASTLKQQKRTCLDLVDEQKQRELSLQL